MTAKRAKLSLLVYSASIAPGVAHRGIRFGCSINELVQVDKLVRLFRQIYSMLVLLYPRASDDPLRGRTATTNGGQAAHQRRSAADRCQ